MNIRPEYARHKVFTRRALLLGAGQFALMSTVLGRMYQLQVIEAERYATLADENRINIRLLAPARGRIVDRAGIPVAVNVQSYVATIVAERARDIGAILDALEELIGLTPRERERILAEVSRRRNFVPVTIRENLEWDDVARIEVNGPSLPGVRIEEGLARHYPFREQAAHLVGYVGAVSTAEQHDDPEPLLELPDFRIGKSGIEKNYEAVLRGGAGTAQIEVNAHGRNIRELSRNDAVPGQDLRLTIDMGVQSFISDRLAEEPSAIAVALDVHRGQVLALASSPSFDPGAFHDGIDNTTWNHWVADPYKPLINKATAGQYAPGSTFKLCVALAALEAGILPVSHQVTCRGYIQLGTARFHCWRRGGHGTLAMREAIKQSCDVYFYDVARRVGVDRIADIATRLGFGAATGIDIPGERGGFMPTTAWKEATFGERWQPGEDLVAGIGQGYVLATPLQIALMCARLVNGGRGVVPHAGRELLTPEGLVPRPEADFPELGFDPGNLEFLVGAMVAVVNEPRGTAGRSRLTEPGMSMGGKTGTSQVRRITRAERAAGVIRNADLPWERRDHALFMGFGPVEAPLYAVAVVVEHGGGGSRAAAPIARDLMREIFLRDPLGVGPVGLAAGDSDGGEG